MRKCPRCKQKRANFLFNDNALVCKTCKGSGRISHYLIRKLRNEFADFDKVLREQNKCCKICNKETTLIPHFSRITGQFRGLLCNKCMGIVGLLSEESSITLNLYNLFILDSPPLKTTYFKNH